MQKIIDYIKNNPKVNRNELCTRFNISKEDARAFKRIVKHDNHQGHSYKKGISIWDIHYPYQDDSCITILNKFLKNYKPDYFILAGDQLDMDMISSYNKHKPLLVEGKRLKKHYAGFQKQILQPLNNNIPLGCKKYFMIGNHEYRTQRYIEEYPQMQGYAEIDNNLDLTGWEIIPYNNSIVIGHLTLIHGHYWNKYHSNKTLSVYDENVYYGHVHNSQSIMKTTPINNEPKEARAVGCMCNKNPDYKRDYPNSWVNEFLFFEVFDNGMYFPHVARIIEGKSIINGKLYVGGG